MKTAEIISHIESPGVRRELESGYVIQLTVPEAKWYSAYRHILANEPTVCSEPLAFKLERMVGWAMADQQFERMGMA